MLFLCKHSLPCHVQLTLRVSKFKFKKNVEFSIVSSGMSLWNTSTAQHISAYLAIIKCINITGEIAALPCTVMTCGDTGETVQQDATTKRSCHNAIIFG
jgi:hypothetical protein